MKTLFFQLERSREPSYELSKPFDYAQGDNINYK